MLNIDAFSLPPLPEVLLNCLTYMYNKDFNYEALVKKITNDIGLTEKILTISNSQYFSQGGAATNNLKQALVRIGSKSLINILTDEYYKSSFGNVEIDFFTLKDLTVHSSYVSHIAVQIGAYLKINETNDLMLAGLFHDVGLLARFFCDKETMKKIVNKCKDNKIDFYTAEKSENIPTHDKIGKEVAIKWNLSQRVAFLIGQHHTPEVERGNATDFELYRELDILMFSDTLAHRMKQGYMHYLRETKISQYYLDRLGLTSEVVAKIASDTMKSVSSYDFN
jgi:HD-like signal output (HDOD) protein